MTPSPPVLREELEGGVVRIILNRPQRRNAIDAELRARLHDALAGTLADDMTRAVVLSGSDGVFCGGGDLASMDGLDPVAGHRRMVEGPRLLRLVAGARKPIVAAVEGWAVGAGAGLAAAGDTVVAGRSARFGFPFVRLGLVPDYGLALTLPLRVGAARARQILLYGRVVPADEALAAGLADEVVDDDAVIGVAVERAGELAALAPFAMAGAKQLLASASLERTLETEAALQALCFLTEESAEGRAAFREKRPPRF